MNVWQFLLSKEGIILRGVFLCFGLMYVWLLPPFQSPDEPNHFYRAWQLSEGHLFPEKNGQRLGGVLPASLARVCDSFIFLKNNPHARLNGHTWRAAMAIPLRGDQRQFTDFANTAMYAPTAYGPQAAAIALLRPLGATPLMMLYGARMANFLIWFLLISAALRRVEFMRPALTAMALLPASLFMAASANADVVTNGLCWWLTAALLFAPATALFWEKLAFGIIVAANKIIAVPLLLLGFVRRFNRRQMVVLLTACLAAAMYWGRLAQTWFIPYDAYDPAFRATQTLNSGVDPLRQLTFLLEHPLFFISTCLKSMVQAAPSMAAHFVGKFGWEKNYLPAGWLALLWMALAALVCAEKNPFSTRQRWGMGAVAALYVGGFAVTMYLLWSAVGSMVMDNWQGRYFVPIAPVVVFAIGCGWLAGWREKIKWAAAVVLCSANLAMFWSIWLRYW